MRRIHRHAFGRQLRQPAEQLHHGSAVAVDLDEAGVLTVEDLARQAGEHALRADFDEDARALFVHGADLVHEFDRPHQMAGKQRRDFLGIFRILCSQRIGENCRVRFGESLPCQNRGEALAGRFHQGRVESAGHRDRLSGKSGGRQLFDGSGDGGVRAGNHRLARAVVVGQGDAFHAVQRLGDGVRIGRYGGHGARFIVGRILDGAAPGFGKIEQSAIGNHSGGGQRGILAVAVAGGHIRTHAQPFERVA